MAYPSVFCSAAEMSFWRSCCFLSLSLFLSSIFFISSISRSSSATSSDVLGSRFKSQRSRERYTYALISPPQQFLQLNFPLCLVWSIVGNQLSFITARGAYLYNKGCGISPPPHTHMAIYGYTLVSLLVTL